MKYKILINNGKPVNGSMLHMGLYVAEQPQLLSLNAKKSTLIKNLETNMINAKIPKDRRVKTLKIVKRHLRMCKLAIVELKFQNPSILEVVKDKIKTIN